MAEPMGHTMAQPTGEVKGEKRSLARDSVCGVGKGQGPIQHEILTFFSKRAHSSQWNGSGAVLPIRFLNSCSERSKTYGLFTQQCASFPDNFAALESLR